METIIAALIGALALLVAPYITARATRKIKRATETVDKDAGRVAAVESAYRQALETLQHDYERVVTERDELRAKLQSKPTTRKKRTQ